MNQQIHSILVIKEVDGDVIRVVPYSNLEEAQATMARAKSLGLGAHWELLSAKVRTRHSSNLRKSALKRREWKEGSEKSRKNWTASSNTN